jgi:hypothetical protein
MLHCLWISCGWDIAHPTAQPPSRWVSTSAYGARQAGASNGGPEVVNLPPDLPVARLAPLSQRADQPRH